MAQVKGLPDVVEDIVAETLDMMEIDSVGLDKSDRAIIEAIIEKYGGGPVGIETIAASIHEDIETIEDVNEPYLMQLGFLKRTPRGRVATKRVYEHLSLEYPAETTEEDRDNEKMTKRNREKQFGQQSLLK
jgi:Holliday junction DNA helicase RuvB